MLVIRLRRIGRKHDPHYRIVVAEHTSPVNGKFIAEVGHYHPKSKEIGLKQDQFLGWIEQGAKPSNTVARLAEREGIAHEHIVVIERQGKPKKKAQEAAAKNTKNTSATPQATDNTEEKNEETVDEAESADKTEDTNVVEDADTEGTEEETNNTEDMAEPNENTETAEEDTTEDKTTKETEA